MRNKVKYQTLIFDLDGTLLNTLGDLACSVNAALSLSGYPEHSEEAVCRMVGNGIEDLVARALPGGRENPDFSAVFSSFRAHYAVHKADTTAPYDGILPMLDRLYAAGCRLAIVSNKIDPAVKELAAQFFGDTVHVAVGQRVGVPKKPAPDTVLIALRELGVTADGAAFVGDSEVDIATAANAGIPCLSVGWGFRTAEELLAAGATRVIATPSELTAWIFDE